MPIKWTIAEAVLDGDASRCSGCGPVILSERLWKQEIEENRLSFPEIKYNEGGR
jgi:hypothetical protein